MKIEQIVAEIMDVSEYYYFLDSVEIMGIVHLINEKLVLFVLVTTSVLTHDIDTMQHQ